MPSNLKQAGKRVTVKQILKKIGCPYLELEKDYWNENYWTFVYSGPLRGDVASEVSFAVALNELSLDKWVKMGLSVVRDGVKRGEWRMDKEASPHAVLVHKDPEGTTGPLIGQLEKVSEKMIWVDGCGGSGFDTSVWNYKIYPNLAAAEQAVDRAINTKG